MDLSALIPTGDTIEVTFKVQVGVTEDDKPKYEVLTKKDGDPCTWTLWAPHSKTFKELTYSRVVDSINASRTKDKDAEETLTVEKVKELHEKRLNEILDVTKTFDLEMDEKPIKYSRKKAKEILEVAPKILATLEEALQKDEVFT